MNKNQWLMLGFGMMVIGFILFFLRGGICLGNGSVLTACIIRRYSFVIPGLILIGLGFTFSIVGGLADK